MNNGHTIQLTPTGTPFVTAKLKDSHKIMHDYKSLQLHFHAPSEHTVGGKQYALEMHIVMVNQSPKSAQKNDRSHGFLGFLFEEDNTREDIPFIKAITDKFVEIKDTKINMDIDLTNLF